jgi:hypothetical protein
MSKITLRNAKASFEVRELKDELSEAELGSAPMRFPVAAKIAL